MVYRGGCTDSTWKSGVCQSTYCFNSKIKHVTPYLVVFGIHCATSVKMYFKLRDILKSERRIHIKKLPNSRNILKMASLSFSS
jgi:hypothetical protein